ncbi:hypothetical protein [Rheinheimera hassiensis]|uniref:hypothetical protein n=1 Tax=Rheinheimera hassiensis TaxID=1193627 RepID=UPI001F05D1F4|nr:hypothetical protein [Rheinheimera hassiensis]
MSQSNSIKSISITALSYIFAVLVAVTVADWVNIMLSLKNPLTAIVFGSSVMLSLIAGKQLALKLNGKGDQVNLQTILKDVKLICIVAASILVGYSLGHQIVGKENINLNLMIGFVFGLLQFAFLTSKKQKAERPKAEGK